MILFRNITYHRLLFGVCCVIISYPWSEARTEECSPLQRKFVRAGALFARKWTSASCCTKEMNVSEHRSNKLMWWFCSCPSILHQFLYTTWPDPQVVTDKQTPMEWGSCKSMLPCCSAKIRKSRCATCEEVDERILLSKRYECKRASLE